MTAAPSAVRSISTNRAPATAWSRSPALSSRAITRAGRAIWVGVGTDVSVVGSTFRENLAFDPTEGIPDDSAGAIYTAADLTVETSTFVGNQSTSHGAAIFAETFMAPQGILDVFNSTFSGNGGLAGDQPAVYVENSSRSSCT